jgi:hypothetical protein
MERHLGKYSKGAVVSRMLRREGLLAHKDAANCSIKRRAVPIDTLHRLTHQDSMEMSIGAPMGCQAKQYKQWKVVSSMCID